MPITVINGVDRNQDKDDFPFLFTLQQKNMALVYNCKSCKLVNVHKSKVSRMVRNKQVTFVAYDGDDWRMFARQWLEIDPELDLWVVDYSVKLSTPIVSQFANQELLR